MKFLKRVVALSLVATLSLGIFGVMPLAGAELRTLTVEEAARRAVSNNSAIANAQDSESVADERISRAQEAVWDSVIDAQLTDASANLRSAELARSLNIRDIQARQQYVEFRITRDFNTILNMQADLALAQENLALAERELVIARLRLSLGVISERDYEAAEQDVTRIQSNIEVLNISIGNEFRSLNNSMGAGLNNLDTQYELELELAYEPLGRVNLNQHAQMFERESLAVQVAANNVEVAGYRVDYFATPFNPLTGQIVPAPTLEEVIVSLNRESRGLTDARQGMQVGAVDMYNGLRELEIHVRALELELSHAERQLETLQTMYKIGRITQIEVDRVEFQISSLENNLRRLKNEHTLLVMIFNNPNLIRPGG